MSAPSIAAVIWLSALSIGAAAGLLVALVLALFVAPGWWVFGLAAAGAAAALVYGLLTQRGRP